MALIEMKGVTKKYHRSTTALRDINVSINPGEFVYIVGPSGAGKSSFIKLLYREEKVSAGTLKVGEFNLTKMKKRHFFTKQCFCILRALSRESCHLNSLILRLPFHSLHYLHQIQNTQIHLLIYLSYFQY